MMNLKVILFILFLGAVIISCKHKDPVASVEIIVKEWKGKKIIFPKDLQFTILETDSICSVDFNKQYKILMYIDSIGCTSCKLKIEKWMEFIKEFKPIIGDKIEYLFIFHPQKTGVKSLKAELYTNNFLTPVCFDLKDELNKINNFPQSFDFQTFLLDKENRVLVVGNPVNNTAIRELYLDILLNRKIVNLSTTQISLSKNIMQLGNIKQDSIVKSSVILQNIGNTSFVILGADVSCRCVSVKIDKSPILPSQKRELLIEYKPKEKGLINESVVIRGNISNPVEIIVRGDVIE